MTHFPRSKGRANVFLNPVALVVPLLSVLTYSLRLPVFREAGAGTHGPAGGGVIVRAAFGYLGRLDSSSGEICAQSRPRFPSVYRSVAMAGRFALLLLSALALLQPTATFAAKKAKGKGVKKKPAKSSSAPRGFGAPTPSVKLPSLGNDNLDAAVGQRCDILKKSPKNGQAWLELGSLREYPRQRMRPYVFTLFSPPVRYRSLSFSQSSRATSTQRRRMSFARARPRCQTMSTSRLPL